MVPRTRTYRHAIVALDVVRLDATLGGVDQDVASVRLDVDPHRGHLWRAVAMSVTKWAS
jgi:hypothetical protein